MRFNIGRQLLVHMHLHISVDQTSVHDNPTGISLCHYALVSSRIYDLLATNHLCIVTQSPGYIYRDISRSAENNLVTWSNLKFLAYLRHRS